MKIFKEMIGLVTKQSLNKIEIFDEKHSSSNDNLYLKLYKGIADGTITSDEIAAQFLYQTNSKNKKYQMLKSRLKDRLTNTLFFLNHKKKLDSLYLQSVFMCNKNYFCAKILLANGARQSAVAMAKSTLITAEKFDLNDIVHFTSKMLRNNFSKEGKKKEQAYYNEKVNDSLKKLKAENRAEFMYETLSGEYAKSKADKPQLITKAKEYFEQSKELAKHQNSFHLYLLYYRIGILYYQIANNYSALLNLCNRFQAYLRKKPDFYLGSREGEIAMIKMSCYHHLRDFSNGKREAEEAMKYYLAGRNNWFTLMENYFLLSMHSQKFEIARKIIEEVENNARFQYQGEEKAETWKIYNAYINYILPQTGKSSNFRVAKFMNEVPIYSKDKSGLYASILIAQIIFLIENWNDEKLEKDIESLRVYASRHLSGGRAPRTIIFIKMLRLLITNSYNLKKVSIRTKPSLEKLKLKQTSKMLEADAMEIIAYDVLWETIINRLQKKKTPGGELRKS